MATLQKSYDVVSYHSDSSITFVLFDYSTREVTASSEWDGRRVVRTLRAKEGIEWAAIQKVADLVAVEAIDLLVPALASELADKVDAYLYGE